MPGAVGAIRVGWPKDYLCLPGLLSNRPMSKNDEVHEDLLLARRAVAGDDAAFSTLYRRNADPLFAFIVHRLGGHRPNAEDVFQDTWLSALRSLPSYRGRAGIFFWLCGIARHKIADRYHRIMRSQSENGPTLSGRRLNALVDDAPLADAVLERIHTRILVIRALAELSEEYRTALIARYVDVWSVGEIAEKMNRTYKATESLLSRARAVRQVENFPNASAPSNGDCRPILAEP